MGFITGTQAWFNILKSINENHHINTLMKNHIALSKDVKKISGKILHPFIILIQRKPYISLTYKLNSKRLNELL